MSSVDRLAEIVAMLREELVRGLRVPSSFSMLRKSHSALSFDE